MNVNSSSIFADIPEQLPEELCQTLLAKPNVRIERIISKGHSSAEDFWYDQALKKQPNNYYLTTAYS